MADQWYYRVFGEIFGPMPLEKLKDLAASGTIQALDDVRLGSSDWVAAATVEELGLSTSERRTAPVVAVMSSTDQELSTVSNDDWYYQMGDHELGPISFNELIQYAEQEQLAADDQVKLGVNGKWRRAGSIGRLMTAFPYQAMERTIVRGTPKPIVERPASARAETIPAPATETNGEAKSTAADDEAKARVAESMIAQANAAFKAAEDQAMGLLAWVTGPGVDRNWWGWVNGAEFGPVEFAPLFGLIKCGQLKSTDMVRNGQYGQYVPAANVPGLYNALAMLTRATEQRDLAVQQAKAAAAMMAAPPAPAPSRPVEQPAPVPKAAAEPASRRKSDPAIATPSAAMTPSNPVVKTPRAAAVASPPEEAPQAPRPAVAPTPVEAPVARSYPAAGSGFSSSSTSTVSSYHANRPAPVPYKAPPRRSAERSTWLPDLLEKMKEPKRLGAMGALVLVFAVFGWGYLPKNRSADIKRYQTLKQSFAEVCAKRNSPGELAAAKEKLEKTAKQIVDEVKKQAGANEPAKQALLWAARDEVPRFIQSGMAADSPAEKNVLSHLQSAAYELGLEKRPPIEMALMSNPQQDD